MSQFAFLSAEFPETYELAVKAEGLAITDPRSTCFPARLALESAVACLYKSDAALRDPFESARIHEPSFRRLLGEPLVAKARIIKDLGNAAVHETRGVAPAKGHYRRPRKDHSAAPPQLLVGLDPLR